MNQIATLEDRIAARIDNGIAGELTVSDAAGGVSFVNVGQVMEFAKMMSIAQIGIRKHLRGNPGACLAICVQAIEWRMSPFAVANKSYLVNDQIAYEAQLVHAVILTRAPIRGRLKHEFQGDGPDRTLRVFAELRDEPGEIVDYETPAFKDIKPKNSPLWVNDPDQQMHYYAARAWCRRHFPDVLLGVYAKDEVEPDQTAGPDKPINVTPKTLAGRLDQLAAAPAAPKTASADAVVERDVIDLSAEHGEQDSGAGTPAAPDKAEASTPSASASPAGDEPAKPAASDEGTSRPDAAGGGEPVGEVLEPLDIARRRAAENYRRGMSRKAVPTEYRADGRQAERDAYLVEFDRLAAEKAEG